MSRGYDPIADRYDDFVRQRSVIHRVAVPALLELCGSGSRVLDLACGQGVVARELARRGYQVVGADSSDRLLDVARGEEQKEPLGITYVLDDATSLVSVEPASIDGVTCSLALTDFDDLDAVLAAVARVLKSGGWLAAATLHPCFEPPRAQTVDVGGRARKQVGSYFEEGRWWPENQSRMLVKIGWYHRTLATLLNSILAAGFALDRILEPRPDFDLEPAAAVYLEVAEVLVLRAVKTTPTINYVPRP